jgi:hypothetical protein
VVSASWESPATDSRSFHKNQKWIVPQKIMDRSTKYKNVLLHKKKGGKQSVRLRQAKVMINQQITLT